MEGHAMRYMAKALLKGLMGGESLTLSRLNHFSWLEIELKGTIIPVILTTDRGDLVEGKGQLMGQYHYGDIPPGITVYALPKSHVASKETLASLVHEIAHALQGFHCGYSGDLLCSAQQELYNEWYYSFSGAYAQASPLEASAETFRYLMGYANSDDHWATDPELLKAYASFWKPILESL